MHAGDGLNKTNAEIYRDSVSDVILESAEVQSNYRSGFDGNDRRSAIAAKCRTVVREKIYGSPIVRHAGANHAIERHWRERFWTSCAKNIVAED
jgi:hypothetical protein